MKPLNRYRRKINVIDRRIMKLFIKRYETVENIGKIKKKEGLPVVDDKREQEIMEKIGLLKADSRIKNGLADIYKTVFSTSYLIEKEE